MYFLTYKTMYLQKDLAVISRITDLIFVSGIQPLRESSHLLREYNIRYLVCCVDAEVTSEVHERLLASNPKLIVLYIPYQDDVCQNLWDINRDTIQIMKRVRSQQDQDMIHRDLMCYRDRALLDIAYHFIDTVTKCKHRVLIHCMAGMSRSVTVVIYFLMRKRRKSFEQALSMVKRRRLIANPNHNFRSQLRNYQLKRDAEIDKFSPEKV